MEYKMTGTKFTPMLFLGWTGYGCLAFFLVFLSVFTGVNLQETLHSSSQQYPNQAEHLISVEISKSLNDLKTSFGSGKGKADQYRKSASILTTELPTNSFYIERRELENQKSTWAKRTSDFTKSKAEVKSSSDPNSKPETVSNYYDIKPTKTVSDKGMKIKQTEMKKNEEGSGEVKGVSMNQSRPQDSAASTNYKRVRRGFGNSMEREVEDVKPDQKKKRIVRIRAGKSTNEVPESLEKIAKVTVSDDQDELNSTTVLPDGFRESRDEENRKASPDIQDIITGIVNILNGKNTKQGEAHTGRPARPTKVRINNRGPPKIADIPPLDFDGIPSYRPLPPPSRIQPPYPFDLPPSMPNIPLPPQPQKPGLTKLPPHPFIEGVPIPELIIPGATTKKPHVNRPELEYDTISSSEPFNNHNISIIELSESLKPGMSPTSVIPVTVKSEINSNATNVNFTKGDYSKTKPSGQKQTLGPPSPIKNTKNKPRPNIPISRPIDKVESTKLPNHGSVPEDDKSPTLNMAKIDGEVQKGNGNNSLEIKKHNASKPISVTEKPIREILDIMNKTEAAEVINDSLKPFISESSSSNINITTTEPEVKRNKTEDLTVGNDTVKFSTERTVQVVGHNVTKFEIDVELPVLLEPTLGFGEATPVLESSVSELSVPETGASSTTPTVALSSQRPVDQATTTETSHHFKVRPGIVLDDPEYKPGHHKRPVLSARPIVTAPPPHSYYGEIFDVTVHAVQGPGGEGTSMPGKPYIVPVDIDGVQLQKPQVIKGDVAVITKPEEGQKFVSIDGKRTYINLFGEVSPTKINPTATQPTILGTGYAVPHKESSLHQAAVSRPPISTSPPRRPPYKRPSHPPVRIDTCIVGDDSTCDSAQNEMCKTEDGVSSCHCRPGYNRKKHRDTCRRVVSMLTSIRVDRLYDRKIKWQDSYRDPDSEDYQQLSYEASQAIESAMSMTPFSDDFINSRVNSIYVAKNFENNEPAVYVNMTIQLEENFDTVRPAVKQDIQRHLLRVIQRRNNNLGNSAVWVDAPPGSVLALQDVDECSSAELHDCHERASCQNTFGSFKCQCPAGLRDPWVGNVHKEGRFCETCSSDYCNGRGECQFEHGQQVCHCSGSFYGSQCEIDGEVLGVAIGASVAAAIIIILTLVCLCMWSRRWSREQKSAVGAGMGSPVFGYLATGPTVKTPSVGAPPYQVSIEDRIRWAQIADVMAKSNHYAQPEPGTKTTRPPFGGYPTLPSHTLSMTGTLPLPAVAPPVPLPRLTLTNKSMMGTYGAHSQIGSVHQSNHGIRSSVETTSSSEEEDRADLLGRNFSAPRPKSRTSIANQSGIYYDVEYDRSDVYSKQNTIPMNTYSLNSQHQPRSYFR